MFFRRDRLHTYTVHFKQGEGDETVFIREGFSIAAFLLGFIWLFYHRAWAPALLVLALTLTLSWLDKSGYVSILTLMLLQFGLQYWVGAEARDWHREALDRRGYELMDIVMETSEERAELRYYERHLMIGGAVSQHPHVEAA